MTDESISAQLSEVSRVLGSRGSRSAVGSDHPAADITPTAAAVLAAIPAWWRARASDAGLDGDWLDVSLAVASPPLYEVDPAPLEREWGPLTAEQVGMAYVEALAPDTRARHGRYYTPGLLAEHLWKSARRSMGLSGALKALPGLVRDPAAGGGALLLPPVREHIAALSHADPQLVINSLPTVVEGIDNDPAAVWVANVVLASEMLSLLTRVPAHRRKALPALVKIGDGLADAAVPARVTLMNPPYGRVRLSEADRARFGDAIYGHANLYAMFMASGVANTISDGTLAAIVPTSFMSGRYFEPLRRLLTRQMTLSGVTFVEDRSGAFASVLQETCVVAFSGRKIRRAQVESLGSTPKYIANISPPRAGKPWIIPRRPDLATSAAAAAGLPLTLREAGWRVRTGPLVWNRRKDDLRTRGGKGRYRILWAADIRSGEIKLHSSRNDKRFIELPSTSVLLQSAECILVQRTSAPEQDKRIVAAALTHAQLRDGPVVIENHVNVLVHDDSPLLSARILIALLRSREIDRLTRCISGSVALSAYELESIPLPAEAILRDWAALSGGDLERAIQTVYATVSG